MFHGEERERRRDTLRTRKQQRQMTGDRARTIEMVGCSMGWNETPEVPRRRTKPTLREEERG